MLLSTTFSRAALSFTILSSVSFIASCSSLVQCPATEQGFMSDTVSTTFKYYLRSPSNWSMLTNNMQEWVHHVDSQILGWNHGAMMGYDFNVPFMRGFLDRPAQYEIRCVHDNPVPLRFILFGDGERSEVRFAEKVPDVLDTDHYRQAHHFK